MIFAWLSGSYAHYYPSEAQEKDCGGVEECENKSAVYRISLGNFLFHTLMFFLTYGIQSSSEPRATLQNSWWIVKIPIWFICILGCYFISQESILQYARFCIFGAAVFIVIQCILLVDLGYTLNETWLAEGYRATILMLTTFMYAVAIVFLVCGFYYFTGPECSLNNLFMSITVISVVLATGLSLTERVNKGVLPPSVVSAYISYLAFSAMMSQTEGRCANGNNDNPYMVIIGAVLTMASVAYSANKTAGGGHDMTGNKSMKQSLEAGGGGDSEEIEDDEKDGVAYNYSFFHFIYAVANCFVAMIIVNWEITSVDDPNNRSVDQGAASVWVKIASQWITIILFFWTLVAPLICPDRFNHS